MSTVNDRLNKAKDYLEKSCSKSLTDTDGGKQSEQYNLCMGLWCLADALLQMQNDIEIIKADVREIKYKPPN